MYSGLVLSEPGLKPISNEAQTMDLDTDMIVNRIQNLGVFHSINTILTESKTPKGCDIS